MAMTVAQQKDAYQFFIIAFGAAPGIVYMDQLNDAYASGMKTQQIVNVYTTKPQFTALYPNFLSSTEFATSLVNNVVKSSASNAAKAEAVADIVGALNSGMTRGDVIFNVFSNLSKLPVTDAKWGGTVALFNNQVAVAEYYTETLLGNSTNVAALQTVVSGVTATSDVSSPAAIAAVLAGPVAPAVTLFSLTTGQDVVSGSSFGDIFSANVVQNSLGEQTNQLATGDKISGGNGIDSLVAVVQRASALNNVPSQAITPITNSVEKVSFTALTVNQAALNTAEAVVINAKSMTGLTTVSSLQSDASLTVQNLTTLTDTGVYADRRNTDSVTIRMDHSGNDRALDAQSNMTVLFDNDYLKSDAVNDYSLTLKAVNNLPLVGNNTPLIGFTEVSFYVGAVPVVVPITSAMTAMTGVSAYNAVKAAIDAKVLALGITGVTVTVANAEPSYFSINTGGYKALDLAGSYFPISVKSVGAALSVGQITVDSAQTSFNGANEELLGNANTAINPVTSNIQLEKVGRGAEGGSLVVGGMSTDLANNWDFSATALKEGVEQFNVLVSGDTTQMSSLSNLSSTNNTLQTVGVTWAAGSVADLIIGNHNTTGALPNGATATVFDGFANMTTAQNNALKDVRTFTATNSNSDAKIPASVQTNDVTLNAYLSNEVVAKYMNRADNIANAATDNANFVYTTGAGNDSLNLNISKANLAASGSATREDFKLSIDAGAGNNTVVTQIGDGKATGATDAWYVNQTIQKNLSVTTGAGNDVVRVNGAGTWNVQTGAGNDAIYSDNSGRQVINTNGTFAESNAVWVFNSADQTQATLLQPLDNLTSAAAVAAATKVANLELTVSYRGINVKVPVGDTALNAGGSVDDLTINQAIKAAINDNVYLSKLLTAQDGTGRTLVVTSLTDGVFSDADLSISVANPVALSAAQIAAGAAFITPAQLTALGLTGGNFVAGGRFDSAIAEDTAGASIVGVKSIQPNANAIDAGTGTDTVVLSTSDLAKETVNVADASADVVFNASPNSTITVDALDTVITRDGVVLVGGVGTVTVLTSSTSGTSGNDVINASNAPAGHTISGLAGNDTIIAPLLGGVVIGGDGSDVITFAGNASADTLVFNSLVGADTIGGYAVANDSINVSKAAFAGVTSAVGPLLATEFESGAGLVAAATAAGRFVYNTTTGALFYDADGSAGVAPVLVATFTGIPTLASTEFNMIA